MILSTLCYIEKDNKYLMLHRVKKKNDINKDKWIAPGGKFEDKESPEECVIREVKEETGYTLLNPILRAVVTFTSNMADTEYMYLFTCSQFEGKPIECNEGDLEWVEKSQIDKLNLWEGDKIFLNKLAKDSNFFTLKLEYDNDKLVNHYLKEY